MPGVVAHTKRMAALGPDHGAFSDLLALVAQRESELHAAKNELQTWLKRNREP
jgi:hypothetical protein